DETPECKTYLLRANALWRGAQAGQFVQVRLEMNGRRVERAYSLSQIEGREIAITVKRQGRASSFIHQHWQVGTVVELSQAAGEFVLPSGVLPAKLLLISAGSGITPMLALLHALQARQYDGEVVLLHICQDKHQFIFARQLQQLADHFPALRLMPYFSRANGRWQPEMLDALVPDWYCRTSFICGPDALMSQVASLWHTRPEAARLFSERFSAAPILPAQPLGSPVSITCRSSERQFMSSGAEPLLIQAERAGLTPKHGCRIGICHSCQCIKSSGTVQNLQTGEINAEPNQLIRICISAARSELVLDL
ncbi:MAG: hypothetical protein RL748_1745, partial [Pseudomonadota bacterium]